MASEIVQHDMECRTGVHTEHLCYIISQGFHLTEKQQYMVLVEEPEYRCVHCSRTAKSDANLCVPVLL